MLERHLKFALSLSDIRIRKGKGTAAEGTEYADSKGW